MISRRTVLVGAGGLTLAGCDRLNESESFRSVLRSAEGLNQRAHRLISARDALAREFDAADISPVFRPNGTIMPSTPEYQQLAAGRFADWRLTVDGLVRRPRSL
ncbi:MAG TPA: molybdopterin-binding protein, partial [Allosphingosinicella sp.]